MTRAYSFVAGGTTGVDSVIDADSDAPVRYYNLQGVEIKNPAPGVYIRVQGSRSSKVVIL